MYIDIKISEHDLKELVANHIQDKTGMEFDPIKIKIEVKSKQNYKSEWEEASYRATYQGTV